MPQVDLETLVSVCGGSNSDRKIACETTADDAPMETEVPVAEVPPDFPPESFWLSKDAEFDWFDRNAFLERKESTKGSSNSNNPNMNQNSNSSSQRYSKGGILGLPKPQKNNFVVDSKRRQCKPANIRLFPKRSESMVKANVPLTEPSSPKVSCMGRVRSKKGRRRSTKPNTEVAKPVDITRSGGEKKKGFYSGLKKLFRSGRKRGKKPALKTNEPVDDTAPRKSVSIKSAEVSPAEPPGLGGMTRFTSGRRSQSWSADDFEVVRQA